MDLEIRHLQLVQAIAEEGGVTRAGARLHLTQSALSHQLRDIEGRLGTQLFARLGRRMVLTPAGEQVLRSARLVLGELERTEQEIRRSATGERGVLRLTTQCNTIYHWLPSRLKLFHREFPDVDVEVVGGATDDPISYLLEGRIDLAIVFRGAKDSGLVYRPLFPDEIAVVMHPRNPLARRPFLAAPDFADQRLIVYSIPRESNMVFREVLIPAGVTPARVTHIQLTEAIIEMVKAGMGISVLPRWTVAPQINRGELVARPLTSSGRFREWSAAYRRQPEPPPYLLGFVDLLARYPVPLGRTRTERKRIPAALRAPRRKPAAKSM